MNPSLLILTENGWVEYPDRFRETTRCFFKRFDTPTRCRCNEDKPGIQVCIEMGFREGVVSFEIDLSGELSDGTWVSIKNYATPKDINDVLAKIPRLLLAWESFNNEI